jgi:hypothetical protein
MQTKPTAASPPPTLETEAKEFCSKLPGGHYPDGNLITFEEMAAFARQQVSAARAEAVADTLKEFVRRIAEDESCGLLGDNPFGYLQAVAAEMFEEAKR